MPFDPCGCIVDMRRSCGIQKLYPFVDSNQFVIIRWYFADQKAKLLPFQLRFGSAIWDTDHPKNPPVGVESGPGRYDKGANVPFLPGRMYCGNATMFGKGVRYAQRIPFTGPVPSCCVTGTYVGDGGALVGGKAPSYEPGLGGARVGGFASGNYISWGAGISCTFASGSQSCVGIVYYVGLGGIKVGGQAVFASSVSYVGEGGIKVGGVAIYYPVTYYAGIGGILVGGVSL